MILISLNKGDFKGRAPNLEIYEVLGQDFPTGFARAASVSCRTQILHFDTDLQVTQIASMDRQTR